MPVRCTGITKQGVRCAKVATRSLEAEGEREWCAQHAPENAAKNVPRCAGLMRNGQNCDNAGAHIVVFQSEEVTVCSAHKGTFEETDGRTLQTPPKPKTKKMTRLAQPSEIVEDDPGNGSGRSRDKGTLRERLISSTEDLYGEIHSALENTIVNAQKRRMTACPSCGHRFSVLIPDYGAIVAAANTLLAKAVPTTQGVEEEIAALDNAPPEEIAALSTGDLKRLLRNQEWSTVKMEAEAETLEETVARHLGVLADYADNPAPDDLAKAHYSMREVLRLRQVSEQLQPLFRVELPELPRERV